MVNAGDTLLPELLAQLRAARVQSFKRHGTDVEIVFMPDAPAEAPHPGRVAIETDPEKAPIHPLDAVLSPPPFVVAPAAD